MNTFTRILRIQENEQAIQHHQDQQETRTTSMLPDCEIITSPLVIDLDAIDNDDDDVIELTATAFAQAKNKSTRAPHVPDSLEKFKIMASEEETKFQCPICLSPFTEEMSTKCGHIFCKNCIKKVISRKGKCPSCRKTITAKELIRVFLPATR